MKNIIFLVFIFLLGKVAFAEMKVMKIDTKDSQVRKAKITYVGEINMKKIAELTSAIDEINMKFINVKNIDLYINSGGGILIAGQMGKNAIKSSFTNVRVFNYGLVGSAATMLYCASNERYAYPGTVFLLHPINVPVGEVKPGVFRQELDILDKMTSELHKIYSSCTSLSKKEINAVLNSEGTRMNLTAKEASEKGLVNKSHIQKNKYDVAYVISD